MAASELFSRYIWLVDLIYSSGGITRNEINRRWAHSSLNNDKEDAIPERTFHRHKEAIKDLFGIDIICDRGGNRIYRIANSEEIKRGSARAWLLNTFSVSTLVKESEQIRHRILFEEIPSGQRFLTPIIEAMRSNQTIHITYCSFRDTDRHTALLEPYCVKVFKQHWYVLARRVTDGQIRIYALDRILDLQPTEHFFNLPENFDANPYFHDVIGVIIGDGSRPEHIEIAVYDGQQHYLRSLPLHHTQQETAYPDHSVFTYYLRPTFDFKQELLRYGASIEVLRPQWLRTEIAAIARAMTSRYQK